MSTPAFSLSRRPRLGQLLRGRLALAVSLWLGVTLGSTGCPHTTSRAFTQHCATAEDCTTEAAFCGCCAAHRGTEWSEACTVICGDEQQQHAHALDEEPLEHATTADWGFDDFGEGGLPGGDEVGPYFEQPALSLVGDASVVLGDCYNLDVRASERDDGGQDVCLVPPVTRRLFPMDAPLDVDLPERGTTRRRSAAAAAGPGSNAASLRPTLTKRRAPLSSRRQLSSR